MTFAHSLRCLALLIVAACGDFHPPTVRIDLGTPSNTDCGGQPMIARKITVSPKAVTMTPGDSVWIRFVTIYNGLGNVIGHCVGGLAWTSDDDQVAQVKGTWNDATITAVGVGHTVIRASRDGASDSISVTIANPGVVAVGASGGAMCTQGAAAQPAMRRALIWVQSAQRPAPRRTYGSCDHDPPWRRMAPPSRRPSDGS